jgi:glycerophosphoryl diester phosphodiesterase
MEDKKYRPFIWGHRGAAGHSPENTIPSFEKAVELGADGVELDVQLTKDGEMVVIHDETVDRVSDGSGWVKDYTFEDLRKLDVNQKFKQMGKMQIPTLREVYELLENTKLHINVELKNGIIFYSNLRKKFLNLPEK